jgi:hypothetical protein
MGPIAPHHVRYIKLGEEGKWAKSSIDDQELPLDYHLVPHEPCERGDWRTVGQYLHEGYGLRDREISNAVREIKDFYTLGQDCLWLTFTAGYMWWTFAHPEVEWMGPHGGARPARRRKAVGWHKSNVRGDALGIAGLSTRLTQVANYRMTICQVKVADYAVRRINGEEEPVIARARIAKSALVDVAADMITGLHWADFETLADLLLTRGGWQRLSAVGGMQSDLDLVIEQAATGERAFVQVKSSASQAVFDDYVQRFSGSETFDRMFFLCHTPKGPLVRKADGRVHLWTGKGLANAVVKAGLFDWLVDHSQ